MYMYVPWSYSTQILFSLAIELPLILPLPTVIPWKYGLHTSVWLSTGTWATDQWPDASSHRLPVVPQLGMGPPEHPSHSCWNASRPGPVQVTIAAVN